MLPGNYIALRGINSFHVVDRQEIREVEVGARHTRIYTPFTVIEVENRHNVDALNALCIPTLGQVNGKGQKKSGKLYPRLSDLPF